jgi:prepilin-type N-terminal cleavage/methylation domain-containing protein
MTTRRPAITPPPDKSIHSNGLSMIRQAINPVSSPPSHLPSAHAGRVHLSHRERSKSSFMISGEGLGAAKERSPHPHHYYALSEKFLRQKSSERSGGATSPEGRGNAAGFSLIELSIVLVILGLLVGGVLTGQSLIRSSEIRSVISEKEKYETAINYFKEKYDSLPGDMPDATAFWGSAGGTGSNATCFMDQTATSPATCNGNGNGQTSSSAFSFDERFASWKHLANAGLIEGNYSGKTGGAPLSYVQQVGTNVPRATIKSGFFDFWYEDGGTPGAFAESKWPAHILQLYGDNSSYSALRPEEAWKIDTKIDDGSPVYGSVRTYKKTSTVSQDCATSDAASASYAVTDNRITCMLHFMLAL